jgi:peptidoglycan/xylan/chitin deacetylase (PgdA/CDA1 family)
LSRRLALTFDDGLLNNVTIGYPILRRLGLPATFFVCPGLIERGRWLWNHEARQRLHYAGAGLRKELGEQFGVPAGVEEFISWMKTLDLIGRVCVERGVREATRGYQPSLAEQHEFEIADWDELRQLDPALVTFASHGMTHAILPCLTGNEVEHEVGESRRLLEARLQRAVDLFAYPNGDESAAVRKAVSRHYGAAVGDTPTPVRPMSDRYSLPRFAAGCGALRLALQMHPRPASQGGARRFKPAAAGVPV